MVESKFNLINTATGCIENAMDATKLMAGLKNISGPDHPSRCFDMTLSGSLRLKKSISIVSKTERIAVLIPFESPLSLSFNMSGMDSRFEFEPPHKCIWNKCDQLYPNSSP